MSKMRSRKLLEKKFWKIPELVEKLLPHLDLDSIKQLAESHELTRKILEKPFAYEILQAPEFQLQQQSPKVVAESGEIRTQRRRPTISAN